MNGLDFTSEPALRLFLFLTLLGIISLLEILRPRRRLQHSKGKRWLNNFSLSILNTLLVAILIPFAGMATALIAEKNAWGLFNTIHVDSWISILIYLLIFDLTIYWQHRLFHRFHILWRLHRVHHTDLDYDVSTGVRFHPFSILTSTLIKLCLIVSMGPAAVAVLISESLLNATSMFNHSNIKLPPKFDAALRCILVTPDMHRVHHSTLAAEQNTNFGFNFPWWDRLFGSYLAQPAKGHEQMKLGIQGYGEEKAIGLSSLLVQPFGKDKELGTTVSQD